MSESEKRPNPGVVKEQNVKTILSDLGWSVKNHPTVRSGSTVFEPDFLAEKDGRLVVLESKTGPATITDVGMLSNIKADERIVIAEGVATPYIKNEADKSGIKILSLDELRGHLQEISRSKKSTLGRAKSRIEFSMTSSHKQD